MLNVVTLVVFLFIFLNNFSTFRIFVLSLPISLHKQNKRYISITYSYSPQYFPVSDLLSILASYLAFVIQTFFFALSCFPFINLDSMKSYIISTYSLIRFNFSDTILRKSWFISCRSIISPISFSTIDNNNFSKWYHNDCSNW